MKKLRTLPLVALILLSFGLFFSSTVKADYDAPSSKVVDMKPGKNYIAEFDGPDCFSEVKYTVKEVGKYQHLSLYVDGKLVKKIQQNNYGYDVTLLHVTSNRTLLAIGAWYKGDQENFINVNPNQRFLNIYEYKNGKMKYLQNLCNLTRAKRGKSNALLTNVAVGSFKSVGSNKITVTWTDSTPLTGMIGVNIAYSVSGNTIKKVGTSHEVRLYDFKSDEVKSNNPTYTAKRNATTYKSVGGAKKSFTIKNGEKIKIKAMTVKNGKRYLKLMNKKGQTGWIQNAGKKALFKEAIDKLYIEE